MSAASPAERRDEETLASEGTTTTRYPIDFAVNGSARTGEFPRATMPRIFVVMSEATFAAITPLAASRCDD